MNELTKWAESVTAKDGGLLHNPTVMLTELAKAIIADNKTDEPTKRDGAKARLIAIDEPISPGDYLYHGSAWQVQKSETEVRNELLDELIEWAAKERAAYSKAAYGKFNEGRKCAFADVMQRLHKLKDRDGAFVSAGEDPRSATASGSSPVTPSPPTTTLEQEVPSHTCICELCKRPTGTSYYANGEDFIAALDELSDSPPPVRIELTAEWVNGQGVTYSASNKDTLPEGGYAASHTSLNELSKTVAEGMKLMFDTDDDVPVEWVFGEGFEVSQDGRVGAVNLVKPPPTPREIAEAMWDEYRDYEWNDPLTAGLWGVTYAQNLDRGDKSGLLEAIITRALQIRDGE